MSHINIKTERLTPFAKALQAKGILPPPQLQQYQRQAQQCQAPLAQYLIEKKLVDAQIILETMSGFSGVPILDLTYLDTECIPIDLVDEKLAHQYQVLPIYRQNSQLYLAMVDPTDQRAIKEMQFKTDLQIYPVIVESFQLARVIKYILSKKNRMIFEQFRKNLSINTALSNNQHTYKDTSTIYDEDTNEPLTHFINKVFLEAINQAASDIHFEAFEYSYRIRYRVDGHLYPIISLSLDQAERITTRLKVLAELDIAEHRLPQDGRFKIKLANNHSIDLRMSTCPTIYGEKIVIRILDPHANRLNIEQLGMDVLQRNHFYQAIQKTQGMVIVTGPTGSGKTTTLYAAINFLNTDEKNILTVEDPVEIKLTGIHQVQVNDKIGLNFEQVLRAFLRQDPDIIMIGEIRDLETAETAIKAAQTGHLVFSTLHSNSAAAAMIRLQNLGVFPYNITSSVSLIIAQRLARKLCRHCKQPDHYDKDILLQQGFIEEELASLHLFKAGNCEYCLNGYHGRFGLYEIMPLSAEMKSCIINGASIEALEAQAKQQGMITTRQSGLEQVKQGIVSLEEVNRITNYSISNDVSEYAGSSHG